MTTAEILKQLPPQMVQMYLAMRQQILLRKKGEGRMTELGCDYRGMDFGANYIDSCCIDGYLWDLDSGDSNSLWIGGDIPCPKCNHDAWIEYISGDIEVQGYLAFENGKTIEDCPFFEGCTGLMFPDDWEVYRGFWLKGFADAQKEQNLIELPDTNYVVKFEPAKDSTDD